VSVLERFRLDGKVAVVTGASSGLGPSFATALADAGADVVLAARRYEPLAALAADLRGRRRRAVAVASDVSRPEDCNALLDRTVSELGGVDILINNAGVATAVPALRETPEQWRSVIDVNLSGCYWMAQAAAHAMRAGGSIVNISSVLAITTAGLPQAAYSASKAGVHGLTRDLAQQWGGRLGIRVNALAPGFFRTEMTSQYPLGYVERLAGRILVGREGTAEELAAAVVFLASDASTYITGQVLVVDGGLTIA
jgi:NAD(P)-dependent dehydrogenase (short-subunit alcohol dehydrogenase family)